MSLTETDRLYDTIARLKPRRAEAAMQKAIEAALTRDGFTFKREHRHDSKNRFDFLVETGPSENVLIEVKVKGASSPDTERQLLRYAALGGFDRIWVVTTVGIRLRFHRLQAGERSIPVLVINLAMNAIA